MMEGSESTQSGTSLFFVYGSLLSGLSNYQTLENCQAEFVGPGKTVEKFYMTGHQDRRYPYLSGTPLAESQEQIAIIGELYRVKNSEIPKLDELEEHPVYYRRRETKILNLIEGSETEAFIYILFSEKIIGDIKRDFTTRFEDVTSGDWRRHGGI